MGHIVKTRNAVWAASFVFLFTAPALTDELRLDSLEDWESWRIPHKTLHFDEDGSVSLAWIRRDINPVVDAGSFSHVLEKEELFGGIRQAPSSPETAANALDQDPTTWWQPSMQDELDDWWIDVDLGRAVLATKLRLTFPDTLDAVPLRNFRVYTSDGVDTRFGVVYDLIAITTEPNYERVFEVDLRRVEAGQATGEFLLAQDTLAFAILHNIRIVATEKHEGASLADIAVESMGDNIAPGTVERFGSIRAGRSEGQVSQIFDGDINTNWKLAVGGDQAKEGNLQTYVEDGDWFEWDLGATYWVDFLTHIDLTVKEGSRGPGNNGAKLFILTTSDGTPASGLTTDRVRSNFDYQLLSDVDNDISPHQQSYFFEFPPRKMRYIFYYRSGIPSRLQIRQSVFEYILHGEGYVAATEMESDFIDLGGNRSIRKLTWDADLPPGSGVQIRTQTGNTFTFEHNYFHKNGTSLDSTQYYKLPTVVRGRIDTLKRNGPDWSGWSQAYDFPEEGFLSPTPRKFTQIQAQLSNDNPQVTPVLRSINLEFDEPLISGGIRARILPRQVSLDSLQRFTYLLLPTSEQADRGFDEVLIEMTGAAEDVEVRIGGSPVEPQVVEMREEGLFVQLQERVTQDSVEVVFTTEVTVNATLFGAWASDSQRDIRQGVEPLGPRTTTVFVPEVALGGGLLRKVEVVPKVFTPNGDAVNDVAHVRFVVVKLETAQEPEVAIYDLAGTRVRVLDRVGEDFEWDGRGAGGELAPPGVYICRIKLEADIGDRTAYRTVNLTY